MVNLEIVKHHLKIENSFDDDYLTMLMQTAIEYVTEITEIENDLETPKRYDLCVIMLVSHWYQNRTPVSERGQHSVPLAFNTLLSSIRPNGGVL